MRLLWFESAIRWAAAITVVSESTKEDLLRLTSCPASKITVIPNPLPRGFEPREKQFCEMEPELLQIGTQVVKNIERIAPALKGLKCHLTIVGRVTEQLKCLLEKNRIRYTAVEGLSDSALLRTYQRADIVLFCSTHEGFGMPMIEANGVGCAVVTSNIEPLRGIAGDAACLVNPHDVESIRADTASGGGRWVPGGAGATGFCECGEIQPGRNCTKVSGRIQAAAASVAVNIDEG